MNIGIFKNIHNLEIYLEDDTLFIGDFKLVQIFLSIDRGKVLLLCITSNHSIGTSSLKLDKGINSNR